MALDALIPSYNSCSFDESDKINYLIRVGSEVAEYYFKIWFPEIFGFPWQDRQEDRNIFLQYFGGNLFVTRETATQRGKVENLPIESWDINIIHEAIKCLSPAQNLSWNRRQVLYTTLKSIKGVKDSRNEIFHDRPFRMGRAMFEHFWSRISKYLMILGISAGALDSIREMEIVVIPN